MNELDALRQKIDRIDREMVALFAQRMAITQQVGEYKQAHHMPVLDNSRQQQVLAQVQAEEALIPEAIAEAEAYEDTAYTDEYSTIFDWRTLSLKSLSNRD